MINVLIIDDEKNNVENLKILIERNCPTVNLIGSAFTADEGKALIIQTKPDLIFLDIQMPGKSGFDLLKSLPLIDFEIIFVTAFDEYAVQAFRFSAIDYLLKPINVADLINASRNAIRKIEERKHNAHLENLVSFLKNQSDKESHRIALPALKETRFVQTGSIVRCESSNNYSTFILDSGERIVVSRPIFEFEELLAGYGFIRCHQSHLVNKKHIKSWIRSDGGYLVLENGDQIPVSKSKRSQLGLGGEFL